MSGLLSIAPLTETVTVRGTAISVPGVSLRGVAALLVRFPELRMLVTGNADKINTDDLFAKAPEAVAAVIAAGTGNPGDADHEAVADSLPIEAQADLITAILRVTLPNGLGALVEKLSAMGALISQDGPATAPVTNSPKPPKS